MASDTLYFRLPIQVFEEILEYLEPREILIFLDMGYIPYNAVQLRHLQTQDEYGNTLLHLAARVPRKPWLSTVLQRYDEEKIPPNRLLRSPIHIAAMHGKAGVVKALLAAGANPFGGLKDPMSFAAMKGHAKTLELLIKRTEMIDYDQSMRQRGRAYIEAAQAGKCKAVDILVKHGVNVCIAPNMIEEACIRGDLRMVKCLARHGGSLIVRWTYQRKPLLQTAIELVDGKKPSVDIIRVLLEAGAVVDEDRKPPPVAWLAAKGGYCVGYDVSLSLKQLLQVHEWQKTTATRDSMNKILDTILEDLAAKGANLRYEFQGNTMLHLVTVRGSVRAAKLLLDRGFIKHIIKRNDEGISPLMLAIRYGFSDLVQLFLQYCKPLPRAITLRSRVRDDHLNNLPFARGDEIRKIITWREGLCVGESKGRYGIFSISDIRLGKKGLRQRLRLFLEAHGSQPLMERIRAA